MDPCDIAQGTVCAYLNDDPSNANQSVYAECTCMQFCGASAATLWACEGVTSGRVTCPATQPESGSSCFGKKGQSCHYPIKTTCDCPAVPSDDTWHCQQDVGTGRLLKAPTGVDAAKPVKDLSDSERQAWCSWFVEQPEPGFPALPEPVADDQGFYTPNGCFASSSYVCGATSSQDLPQSACVANLALSTCEQPVSFLTQCVQWMRGAPGATRGCGGYLQAPGCNGTIVTAGGLADTNPPGCRLRIE
jgi:hypothetical protein